MKLKIAVLTVVLSLPLPVLAEAPLNPHLPLLEQIQEVHNALPKPQNSPQTYETPITRDMLHSCIKYVRSKGVPIPYGTNADSLYPNTTPFVGAVALFRYPNDYHVAYVERITEEGFYISETNYSHGKYTERFISWDDIYLRGFWYP